MGSSPSRPGHTKLQTQADKTVPKKERPSDEEILRYEEEIREREVLTIPIVSDQMPLECLIPEYEHAVGFQLCMEQLLSTGKRLRRMRGDGSCFYRAVGFHLIEMLISCPNHLPMIQGRIQTLMDSVGFDRVAYEDFLQEFEAIVRLGFGQDGDWLASEWRKHEWRSNAIVVVLRMLCSAFLRSHAAEYEAFIMHLVEAKAGQTVMEVFCQRHVECVGQEADQIHVIALAKALRVTIEIAQMEDGHALQHLQFGPDDDEAAFGTIHLLYRPGHYDLLY